MRGRPARDADGVGEEGHRSHVILVGVRITTESWARRGSRLGCRESAGYLGHGFYAPDYPDQSLKVDLMSRLGPDKTYRGRGKRGHVDRGRAGPGHRRQGGG